MKKTIFAILLCSAMAWGQCARWVPNPHTGKMDCAQPAGNISIGATLSAAEGLNAWNVVRESRAPYRGNALADFSTTTGYAASGTGATIELVDSFAIPEARKATVKSLKWTIPAGVTSELSVPGFTAQNIPRKVVSVWVESDNPAAMNNREILLLLGEGAAYTRNAYGIMRIRPRAGLQVYTYTKWTETGTPPDWGLIGSAKLRATATAGGPAVVTVHALVANQSALPTVSIIFDDGHISNYTEGLPLLERYGFKAGFAIIHSLSTGDAQYMPLALLKSIYADGHDMMPHGQNSPSSYATLAQYYADIEDARSYLASNGMTRGANDYVYIGGDATYNGDTDSIPAYLASHGFRSAYHADSAFDVLGTNPLTPTRSVLRYHLERYALNASTVAATALADIDRVTAAGLSVVLMAHTVVVSGATGDAINRSVLDTILSGLRDRVNQGKFVVVRPSDAAQAWGL